MPKKVKSKTDPISDQDISFSSLFSDAKPVKHDKYELSTAEKRVAMKKKRFSHASMEKQASALFEFSDGFEASFSPQGPLKYVKEGERSDEVKRLRNGEIPPDLVLDLHGLNTQSAKHEIAALIYEAHRRHHHCVCIVHGIGAGVLKSKVPSWLVQHPYIEGFHQAPLEWGGKGAILALVKQNEEYNKFD
ncbi:endonuclease SmrB [Glaciecola sp. MH2013]|uniref:endonuclease SmrB n=1 Tax=Glaciecola sp. MH2013 TaxID=2785524 RepID=UPI00189FB2F1|nr:endonuclease SmrB [Glaciecola sp. MH2013]MBF7072466.1 endonuclease SmrB [Glaciecola sp. MH2013]